MMRMCNSNVTTNSPHQHVQTQCVTTILAFRREAKDLLRKTSGDEIYKLRRAMISIHGEVFCEAMGWIPKR
jgi:hypothetical protein